MISNRMFVYIAGLKLRRQHWFFLGCLLGLICLLFVIWMASTSSATSDLSKMKPEQQAALVADLLKEVPLIDG